MDCRVWAEIDLTALKNNYRRLSEIASPLDVFAVVKADAYNLGAEQIVSALIDAGASHFCIAVPEEANDLKHFGKPLQLLGGLLPDEVPFVVEHDLIVGVTDEETGRLLSVEAERCGKTVECHLKLDTGMGRLGFLADGMMDESMLRTLRLPHLNFTGIYSHFPKGDKPDDPVTMLQISRFRRVLAFLKENGITFKQIHFANSDAIRCCTDALSDTFNGARAGLALYGFPTETAEQIGLKPVAAFKSRLISIRHLPAGATISYNCTHRLEKDTMVGVICAGYADGIPLQLSNRGSVLLHGRRCPVLGRVCMDYMMISLDGFAENEVHDGDIVTLFGRDGTEYLSPSEWASLKGTHVWDILCSFGSRVERVYLNS